MNKLNEMTIRTGNGEKTVGRILAIVCIVALLTMTSMVFADDASANATFNTIIKFIAVWIGRLGMVVAFIGAVQTGFAVKNDDADGKSKGLRTLISGFIVLAITQSLNMFGIS